MNYDGLTAEYWQEQIERVERVRQAIVARSEAVAGHVVPGDDDLAIGSGRRLSATVLFVDISGFSSRRSISASEQENMLRALNLFMTEMIRVVEDYGGAVEKNTGDGLLAYFDESALAQTGANSTKRAIACALTMSAANDLLVAPVLRATDMAPFQIRITVEYGPITVARIGPPRRFNANVAIGNAANFAAKALGWISPGQIGLGAAAAQRIPPAWFASWTTLSPVSTGWVYSESDRPYPLYLYTGRWSKLI